jgi:hypothetical protein
VGSGEPGQRTSTPDRVQRFFPWLVGAVSHRVEPTGEVARALVEPAAATPVIDEPPTRHDGEPCHRHLFNHPAPDRDDRGGEGLRRQVLGEPAVAAAGEQVAVDLRERGREGCQRLGGRRWPGHPVASHTRISNTAAESDGRDPDFLRRLGLVAAAERTVVDSAP